MRVGVDALNVLRDRRGIGRYARALLHRWMQRDGQRVEFTLLVPHVWPNLVRRRLAAAIGVDDVRVRRRNETAAARLQLVWYPWNGMTWTAPTACVATIHDVWPFASPSMDVRKRRSEQTPFRTSATYAKAIITDSDFSKAEILKHLWVPPGRLHVVPLGVDPATPGRDQPLLLDGASRYVLFVGEAEPRKDLTTLSTAMARLPDALRMTTGLVIAGKPANAATRPGRLDRVRREGRSIPTLRFEPVDGVPTLVTGPVPDGLLDDLYAGAGALAFPSRYEGFGLPVLEAMAHGAPVVASRAASIPEVAGDAALYFPAGDAATLASELLRVLTDQALIARLRAAGISRAAAFTWERCAQETLAVFESVCASERG